MSTSFLFWLFIASSLSFFIVLCVYCFKRNAGVIFKVVIRTLVIIFVFSAAMLLSFAVWNKPVVTYGKIDEYSPQQLARLTNTEDAEYYLMKEKKNITFVYIEDNKIHIGDTDTGYCRIHYGSSYCTVETHKFTEVYHNQWWFVKGEDRKNVLYKYDIYIPSKKNILNTHKK